MIKLIVGKKGSGKTKALLEMIEEAVGTSKGSVVCIEKGNSLKYNVSHQARLVDIEDYDVSDFNTLYGFLAGMLAGNYDITDLFVDATLKIGGSDLEGLAAMSQKLDKLTAQSEAHAAFTVSCDAGELPESLKKYL